MLPDGPYDHSLTEKSILDFWLKNSYYKFEYSPTLDRVLTLEEIKKDTREFWSVVCPPPNAYGRPHIGNISGYAYIDMFARFNRMLGKKVLVLPGKDHAGLEGEGMFVREVLEKQKRYKFDMKREDFYREIMEWFKQNMEKALKDEKEIGLSADFDKDTFTLDPQIVEIVLDTFVEMYDAGMIYKGVRIANWDPKAKSVVADNQVMYEESTTPFYYFKYITSAPETRAIQIKNSFAGEKINWKINSKLTKDKNEGISFSTGHIVDEKIYQDSYMNQLPVIAIGYETGQIKDEKILSGKAIGILMALNQNYKLLVVNEKFDDDLKSEILKIFQFESKYIAGAHVILFDEYPEDKAYTNGFVIGTVRPETIFADTAIACSLDDERYKDFVGKKVIVEFLGEKKELNFLEDFSVEKDFGTGLLKVTPAHSSQDWEIAQRHTQCLPPIQVIGYDLKLNKLAGKFFGLKAKDSRSLIAEEMIKFGNLVFVDDNYKNRIQIAERTKAPIEPLLSSQWYLNYEGNNGKDETKIKYAGIKMVFNANKNNANLSDETIKKIQTLKNLEDQSIQIHPESMEAKFNYWMENLRDWAISRSLWWGYRLPVWYYGKVKEEIDENGMVRELIKLSSNKSTEEIWIPLEYNNKAHLRVQKDCPAEGWKQDESVLDTWFSSGQWPFALFMKYGLSELYPNTFMLSGFDILENWDSRMMMFSYFKTGKVPFKDLFLTGLVKGTDGQKMSKSKGNILSIDDLRAKYGTDAIRMVYFYQNSAGADYSITYEKLDTFKKFINKIWNVSKFVLTNIKDTTIGGNLSNLKIDSNIELVNHIEEIRKKVTKNIENFDLGIATFNLYQGFWHEFADVFVEKSKQNIYEIKDKSTNQILNELTPEGKKETLEVLLYSLKTYLKLLHPFIPFVTQRIWDEIPKKPSEHKALMYNDWFS